MNKHIELVEKWLADKESVSAEELRANKDAAEAAYGAAYEAANAANASASTAAAAYEAAYKAAYYINKYRELTKEDV